MRGLPTIVMVLVLCLPLAPAMAAEDRAPDATVNDPEVHNVVLDNDHVRVFEVMAAPGYESPMHSHHPLVFVSCDSVRTRMTPAGGEAFLFDAKPGTVLWLEDVQHSWEVFAGNLHGYGVEIKSARSGKAPAPQKAEGATAAASGTGGGVEDATLADPAVHRVVLENDHVRVFEALGSAGHESPMHSHPPMVIVSCDTARLEMTPADGKAQFLDVKPGTVLWLGEGARHTWKIFAGNLHAYGVEPKAARTAGM